jgi:hypothetical protein
MQDLGDTVNMFFIHVDDAIIGRNIFYKSMNFSILYMYDW